MNPHVFLVEVHIGKPSDSMYQHVACGMCLPVNPAILPVVIDPREIIVYS